MIAHTYADVYVGMDDDGKLMIKSLVTGQPIKASSVVLYQDKEVIRACLCFNDPKEEAEFRASHTHINTYQISMRLTL